MNELDKLLKNLEECYLDDDLVDDEEPVAKETYLKTRALLNDTYSQLENFHLEGYPTTLDGEIRIRWQNNPKTKETILKIGREVRLVVDKDNIYHGTYVYHQEDKDFDGEYEVTSARLKYWLEWLNEI